jgi:hypothetical protein
MKYLLSLITVILLYPFQHYSTAAKSDDCCGKCVGSAYCTACTSCQYCKHCNSGGACGMCVGVAPAPSKSKYIPSKSVKSKPVSKSPRLVVTPDDSESDTTSFGQVNTTTLNVRSGPGTGWSIVTKLSYGDFIQYIISENSNWYLILDCQNEDAIGGYVAKNYID